MYQIARVSSFASLDGLRFDWNELSRGMPFRRFEWLGSWAETYLREEQLYVLEVRDNSNLVGLMPLYRSVHPTQGRVLRWLGSGEVCTDYLGIMLANEVDSVEAVSALANWLVEASDSRDYSWDAMDLNAVDSKENTITELVRQLGQLNCKFHQEPGLSCWRIALPDTWDDYLAMMSRSHRKQLRRVERRMGTNDDTRIVSAIDETSFAQGMEILVHLHQKRRYSLGERGCFASQRFSDFLHQAALRFLPSGILRLSWAEVDDAPLACEFQLAGKGTTYAYQAGVDPDRMEKEPGRLIMMATIQEAISNGQTAFDFLRGNEPYKAHWRATERPTLNWRIIAPTTEGRLRQGIWKVGCTLKGIVRSAVELGH